MIVQYGLKNDNIIFFNEATIRLDSKLFNTCTKNKIFHLILRKEIQIMASFLPFAFYQRLAI